MLVKASTPSLLAISIAAALAAPVSANVEITQAFSPEVSGELQFDTSLKSKALKQDFPQYFIVQLQGEPLATTAAVTEQSGPGNKLDLSAAATQKQGSALAQERSAFAAALKQALPNAEIDRHFDTVINAVVVTSTDDIYEQLQNVAGVKAVFREEMYYEQMDTSLDLIKAKAVWEQLGGDMNAGKGVKVAVIDGGIRPESPLFKDTGFAAPASKPNNDYCATVEPTFCNNKLIVARFSTPTFATVPQEYMSPLGNGGHGTHTAGTAVGVPAKIKFNGSTNIVPTADGKPNEDGFTEVTVSGVAPGAYLMAYKALFQVFRADGSVTGSGSNVMLLEALDWAVKDGADVINNSWGGSAGANPSTSPYQAAFKAAEDAGVVVVTSAGNSGPAAQTVGCPGCIESGITIASTTTGRFFGNTVKFGSEAAMLGIAGSQFGATISGLTADPVAKVVDAAKAAPTNALACTAFPADTFKDSFALISRGTCAFTDKINNAMAAGAKGVIMVQNNDGQPTSMSNPNTTIPSLMISKADGAKLAKALESAPNSTATISRFASRVVSAQFADNMSDFSSRGPDGDNNILKPDMGAPGSDILSATSPDQFEDKRGFQLMSGTSMAAPHVAGAAAIMQQKFPKWTAVEIKTALTSTAVNGLKKEDSVTATTPFDIGAGRLDLSRAVKAAATFDKPSFAQNPCVINCNFTRSIRNMTDKEVTWTGTVQFTDGATTGKLDKTSITLKPYGTAGDKADFVLSVDGTMATYGSWVFGNVLWTSSDATAPTATMPVAVRVANTADATTLATASSTVMKSGEPTQVTASFGNKLYDKQVTILATAPAGTKLVAGSESAVLKNATEFLLDGNANNGRVAWTGLVQQPKLSVAATGSPSSTVLKGSVAAATCSGECDDNVISYNLGGSGITINYGGVAYGRLHVSTNGFVQLSNSATAPAAAAVNAKLPSTVAAANILAPFWTDLDLAGGSSGAGTMHVGLVSGGDTDYIIVEWNGVEVYDEPGKTYTFQTWMAINGPEDIMFNYMNLGATPSALTVGVQDASRTLGNSIYFADGATATGTAPGSNSGAGVSFTPSGTVDLKYALDLTGALELGTKDTATTAEDTKSAAIDVLANEKTSFVKIINVEVTSDGKSTKAINKAAAGASGALSKVAIATQPANGTAEVVEGKVMYTPKANFNGKDTFTYTAEDAKGLKLVPTTVEVTVTAVNDAPTVTGATVTANESSSATLAATGADVDGDALTYTWTQTSGPAMTVTGSTASVSVTTPAVTANTVATFSVVASDGKLSSAPATVTLNITDVPAPVVAPEKKSSGGGAGLLSLLLLPLVWLRRNRRG
ncbi:S8 family serine peptidase [Rheinheimera texasensis]|uniref:S8 family serine peptidase n=1 Tax=Rheinheimera texasensis TaxID=306205 RepID=UPI0004E0E011|nr:S8 family serine peptidase [Rheinheimera texasensis]